MWDKKTQIWKKKNHKLMELHLKRFFSLEILLHNFIHIINDVKIMHADISTYLKAIKKTKTGKLK